MFWRNNYLNEETLNEYLISEDRTNYTYSESQSYRSKVSIEDVQQPKLFRYGITSNGIESNETNVNTDYVMRSKTHSVVNTPRQRRSIEPNNRRVLRSKSNTLLTASDINGQSEQQSDIDEENVRRGYRIGALNTNTNNSGPDNIEQTWTSSSCDYHLSGDEDQGSDNRTIFDTNNANINKLQRKESNQWFQKNMFGLPNDESDEVSGEFSGAISGDENYDIASLNKSNRHHSVKSVHTKRSLKSDMGASSSSRRFDSILCSPVAVVSYLFEYMWLCVVTTTRVTSRCCKHLENYSKCPRWFLLPFYLPGAIINSAIYLLAYSIDRILGTTAARRWLTPSSHRNRSTCVRLLFNTLWLLFWAAIAFIFMHLLIADHNNEVTSSHHYRVSDNLYKVVDKDCMVANDCCHSNWALGKRFAVCMLTLPTKWIVWNTIEHTTVTTDHDEVPPIIQKNSSDVNDILYNILERLRYQEELIKTYNSRVVKLENDSVVDGSNRIGDDKLSPLTNEIKAVTIKLEQLQRDFQHIHATRTDDSNNVVEAHGTDSLSAVKNDVEILREKLDGDMKSVHFMLDKADKSISSSTERTEKLTVLLGQVQDSILQLKMRIDDINGRTTLLETANEKSKNDSKALKKEILDEVSKKFEAYKEEQSLIAVSMNEQMSKLEEILDKDYSKLLDKEYLRNIIEAHLEVVESNIKEEVNSTIWSRVKDHIQSVLQSVTLRSDRQQADRVSSAFPNNIMSQSCHNRASTCRHLGSCVRVATVRQMIADALNLYSADRIGLADYALESAGGTIATIRCTETYTDRAATLTIFGIPLLRLTNSPRTIIQPSINPGECWAMKGNKGSVVVQLSARVHVTAVSIDHIPKSLSPSGSIDSAIKEFEIRALMDANDSIGQSLGNFTYDINSSAIQTFMIEKYAATNLVEMSIKSNYGNEDYTCIYRLRVHGNLLEAS